MCVYCRLLNIEDELQQYESDPEQYAAGILDVYNIDIENDVETALLPPPFPNASAQGLWAQASEGLGDCVAYMSSSMEQRLNPDTGTDADTGTGTGGSKSETEPRPESVPMESRPSAYAKPTGGDGGYCSGVIVNDMITADDAITYDDRYWNWRDCELSSSYDMYLLKYETDLQLELGTCIRKLMKDLTTSATQQLLTVTVFAALMSAVLLPVTLVCRTLTLLSSIPLPLLYPYTYPSSLCVD